MSIAASVPDTPVASVAEAIARMEAIDAALPAADGVACFNRMYLAVTQEVNSRISAGFFADPVFMAQLDVTFANLYFAAAGTWATWRPCLWRGCRSRSGGTWRASSRSSSRWPE